MCFCYDTGYMRNSMPISSLPCIGLVKFLVIVFKHTAISDVNFGCLNIHAKSLFYYFSQLSKCKFQNCHIHNIASSSKIHTQLNKINIICYFVTLLHSWVLLLGCVFNSQKSCKICCLPKTCTFWHIHNTSIPPSSTT